MNIFWSLLGGGPFFGWWWVVVDIYWLVVGGCGYILAGGGWWWVVVDMIWLVVGGGGWWQIYFGWWWVVVGGGIIWSNPNNIWLQLVAYKKLLNLTVSAKPFQSISGVFFMRCKKYNLIGHNDLNSKSSLLRT